MTLEWLWGRSTAIKNEIVEEVKPVWLSVEDRLEQIAKSGAELKKEADDIKDIASLIVRNLGIADNSTQILKDLAPILQEIPPLLKVVPPVLKSIDSQFETINKAQIELRDGINKLHALISDISEQLSGRCR